MALSFFKQADNRVHSEGTSEQPMASCSTAGNTSPISVDSQLQQAVRLKTEGNAFYRDKNIRSAIGRYHRALIVLRGLDSKLTAAIAGFGAKVPVLNAEQQELLSNTQIDCYNNLAGIYPTHTIPLHARSLHGCIRALTESSFDIIQWQFLTHKCNARDYRPCASVKSWSNGKSYQIFI